MGKRRKSRQALARYRERGHQAFLKGAYTEAIEEWGKVKVAKPTMLPSKTLAEAYFRRGLTRFYENGERESAQADLEEALKLAPAEARYHYHLGLLLHHLGNAKDALPHYRQACNEAPFFRERIAYPLALALMQQGDAPQEDEVWAHLSAEEQAILQEGMAFNRRPYTLSEEAPVLWQGLAALDEGERAEAEEHLETSLKRTENQMERALAHYYRGVLAARRDDMDEARRHWLEAAASGLETPALTLNLGESFHRLAEARLEAENLNGALEAAREARRYRPGKPSLEQLIAQAHQRLGYRAAQAGRWDEAQEHWERAYELEDGNFRLAFNLALCYERQEDFITAGETWREVLRRRPRLDDDPDALDDEQIAQIWKRAAEAYVQAGEYDEAVHVYRQAVKYNPDHLSTRMALVESLMSNGQFEAAENELRRILEKDSDYVPALVQMGEIQAFKGYRWLNDPAQYWERALELDPNNVEARESLINYYLDEALDFLYWNNIDAALDVYEEILSFAPHHGLTLSYMGQAYLMNDDRERAHEYLEQAIEYEPTLDRYFHTIIICFRHAEEDWAWEYLESTEADLEVPTPFYLNLIKKAMTIDKEYVAPLAERCIAQAKPDETARLLVAETFLFSPFVELAAEYFEKAKEAEEHPIRVHFGLAAVAARQGDRRTASYHLSKAERIARRQKDQQNLQHVHNLRQTLLDMPPTMLEMIFSQGLGLEGGIPFPPDFL